MKVHLIGIGGTGMGNLAGLLKQAGHEVRGSDENLYPPMSTQLAAADVVWFDGFAAKNLDWAPDRVVVGNACRKDHVEVVAAQERGLKLVSFPGLFREVFLIDTHSVVVAGTHGKTTSSALLAHTLSDAGLDPSFLIGGVPRNFGSGARLGSGKYFVVEGDEYDSAFFEKQPKFLQYQPKTAMLTSVELDHVDIYKSFADVLDAFARFVKLVPADGLLVVSAASPHALELARQAACPVETYAVDARAVDKVVPLWQAEIGESHDPRRVSFSVTRAGEFFGTFEIGLLGAHNVENALGVIAVGASLGLSTTQMTRALHRFRGVKRRQEFCGVATGVTVIDDYGHHPTAVRETISALRQVHGQGKLLALYEPRSATSRRATFQDDYVAAFEAADTVVVAPLFKPDGIPVAERFSREKLVADLRARGTAARAIDDAETIARHVADDVKPGDCVVAFSSGHFDGVTERILRHLGDPITPARPADMEIIQGILEQTGLGDEDTSELDENDFLVVSDEAGITGCVALQQYDDAAILRSLAVVPERRGRGLGWMLADCVIGRARAAGVRRLYLLTESASDFFAAKLGFRAIDRRIVEASVAASVHFQEAVASAVVMRLDV